MMTTPPHAHISQSSLIIFKNLSLLCGVRPGPDVSAFQCVEMFYNRGQVQKKKSIQNLQRSLYENKND